MNARSTALQGVGMMVRHILRRDRVRMLVWLGSLVLFVVYFGFALSTVFDEAALAARAAVMRTPSGIVMGGPGYGLDDYTSSVAMANEGITWIVLALSLMAIFHIVRHTRAEEESGRSELVRANPVGRQAPAVAAVLTLAGHLLLIALAMAGAMVVSVPGADLADALAMMLGSALAALVFGALALVASQVVSTARGAIGLSLAGFGLFFVIRAAGDLRESGGSTLSWFSPIAWPQQMRPFVDLRWWPLWLAVASAVLLVVLAAALATRRDFGAGLVAARPGRATAAAWLSSPFALAVRQQRSAFLWTAVGLALLWFGTGTMMQTLNDMVADLVETTPMLGQLFGNDPAQFAASFLTVMMLFLALCAAAYGIVMGARPKSEETSGRLELVLSSPVSRSRWFGAQMLVSTLGTLLVLASSVLALWIGSVSVGVDDPGFHEYSAMFLAYSLPTLVFVALTLALIGWLPRLSALSWAALAFVFVIGLFGSLFDLPDWVLGISPYHWMPESFGGEVDAAAVMWLALSSLVGYALALIGFRRRDLSAD